MQWEHACLVQKLSMIDKSKVTEWEWCFIFYFHSPTGVTTIEGASAIEILNQLGRDGWEALAVEPRYADFPEQYDTTEEGDHINVDEELLVERTIWLKRPISTSNSS